VTEGFLYVAYSIGLIFLTYCRVVNGKMMDRHLVINALLMTFGSENPNMKY
jgi:hypothetical protein